MTTAGELPVLPIRSLTEGEVATGMSETRLEGHRAGGLGGVVGGGGATCEAAPLVGGLLYPFAALLWADDLWPGYCALGARLVAPPSTVLPDMDSLVVVPPGALFPHGGI